MQRASSTSSTSYLSGNNGPPISPSSTSWIVLCSFTSSTFPQNPGLHAMCRVKEYLCVCGHYSVHKDRVPCLKWRVGKCTRLQDMGGVNQVKNNTFWRQRPCERCLPRVQTAADDLPNPTERTWEGVIGVDDRIESSSAENARKAYIREVASAPKKCWLRRLWSS